MTTSAVALRKYSRQAEETAQSGQLPGAKFVGIFRIGATPTQSASRQVSI